MIDFDSVFNDELVNYTISNHSEGSIDSEGNWVKSGAVTSTFKATETQPLKMNELSMLQDGEKVFSYVKIYTSSSINTRNNAQDSDIVTHSDGRNFKVIQSEYRQSHYKIYMRLT